MSKATIAAVKHLFQEMATCSQNGTMLVSVSSGIVAGLVLRIRKVVSKTRSSGPLTSVATSLMILGFLGILGGCEPLLFYPSRKTLAPSLGHHEDVCFKARDGTRLHGWVFPSATVPPKGTIVQFHGNAGNITSHHQALAWIVRYGYNLLTFDYRGYGMSEGTPSLDGLLLDGLAALAFAERIPTRRACGDIFIVGQSLGGAVSVDSYAHFADKKRVGALVLTSTFQSYRDIASGVLWRAGVLAPFAGVGFAVMSDKHSPWRLLDRLPHVPILVIHDVRDPVIPIQYGETLFSLANRPKRLWMTDLGEHVRVFEQMDVREAFVDYLDRAHEVVEYRRNACQTKATERWPRMSAM